MAKSDKQPAADSDPKNNEPTSEGPKDSTGDVGKTDPQPPVPPAAPAVTPVAGVTLTQPSVASENDGWIDPVPVNVPAGFWLPLSKKEVDASGAKTSYLRVNPGPQMMARSLLDHWYVKACKVTTIK